MYVEYEYQCANCTEHEDTKDSWKIYCKYYKTYYNKDEKCDHQQRIVKGEEGTPCYITTMVCNLLGYDDNCGILETLRSFRDNVMQKDSKYKEILFEYDTVGPKIANYLLEDYKVKPEETEEFVVLIHNFYLQPTVNLINEKKYDDAVARYSEMTKSLKEYYSIDSDNKGIENYDYKHGGHGKRHGKMKKIGEYPQY